MLLTWKGWKRMFGMSMDIGIDLGTANVLVYIKGKGIVMREPSVVAIDNENSKILAIGEEARRMIGRTPGNIVAIRPLRDGVIANYDVTEQMIRYFIGKVSGRRFMFRPRVMICVPSRITTVEKRAVQEAAMQAGAAHVELIEEPMAAAMGAGLDVAEPNGCMIVDIGGGTTDVAVISLGGIVVSDSIRMAGDKFDECIINYVKNKHSVMIGERTAENIKINIGEACKGKSDKSIEIRGRDLIMGLPKTITLTSDEVAEALSEPVQEIIRCVKKVLEETPPELASDIMDQGIVMTGGGALLHGLDELIQVETGINTFVSEDAMTSVAIGTGKALEYMDKISKLNKKPAANYPEQE